MADRTQYFANYHQKRKSEPEYIDRRVVTAKRYVNRHPWYKTYYNIIRRCTYKNHVSYPQYGGKGIKVLVSPQDLKKMWYRDKAYLMKTPSIDRKDSSGHYTVDNCCYVELYDNICRRKD